MGRRDAGLHGLCAAPAGPCQWRDRRQHHQRADIDVHPAAGRRGALCRQRRVLSQPADRGAALRRALHQEPARRRAQIHARYLQGVRFYNDALADGRLAGPNGPEVISILTKYSSIKDAEVYRAITPPAIDPDGVVNIESLTKDWQFFRDTGQLDGKLAPADIVDRSLAAAIVN